MVERVKLMLVGEHKVLFECLAAMLVEIEQFSVVEQIGDLNTAVAWLGEREPDVLLVELGQPDDGKWQHIRDLHRDFPAVKVLILGLPDGTANIVRSFEAGASGYLLKDSSLEDLRDAIESVVNGGAVCSEYINCTLFDRLAELAEEHRGLDRAAAFELSGREFEILELLAGGLSNKQIATELCLSIHTVKNHVHHVLEKLEVEDRHAAVQEAFRRGWLRPQSPPPNKAIPGKAIPGKAIPGEAAPAFLMNPMFLSGGSLRDRD